MQLGPALSELTRRGQIKSIARCVRREHRQLRLGFRALETQRQRAHPRKVGHRQSNDAGSTGLEQWNTRDFALGWIFPVAKTDRMIDLAYGRSWAERLG